MSGAAGQIIARSKNGGNVRAPGCRYGGGRWTFRKCRIRKLRDFMFTYHLCCIGHDLFW